MPNQANFRSDITTKTEPRFLASRIIRVPDELILLEELAASFGFDIDDNLELHFYSATDNILVLSTVIRITDNILKSHVVSYADGTYKNHIRIDFTKLFIDKNLVLLPGDYRVVMNFFSDEIGRYDNRILSVSQISPSRTEVELVFNNTTDEIAREQNLVALKEFVEVGLNKTDAAGLAQKIYTSVEGTADDVVEEGLTSENVISIANDPRFAQPYEDAFDRIERLGLDESFSNELNNFIFNLYKFVLEEIVIHKDDRIQEDEYQEIIKKVIKQKIGMLQVNLDSRIKII